MTASIGELIASLSTAIWQRASVDPTFNLVHHLTHPCEYVPKTEEELQIWKEITHPDHYIELCTFAAERQRIPGVGGYPIAMDCLLLTAAKARYDAAK